MTEKVGRNDPCPCGSGKKYKACCMQKQLPKKTKLTAKWVNQPSPKPVDLMERAFGNGIARGMDKEKPEFKQESQEK